MNWLIAVSGVLIVATVLPFIRRPAWWMRLFDFPRSQITVIAIAAVAALAWKFDGSSSLHVGTLVLMSFCTAYQAWELSRYTKLRKIQSLASATQDPERRVRVLIGNVLMTNRNVDQYLELIREEKPDIVILAEPGAYWEQTLRQIECDYPFSIKCPLENTYGMLLYSKLPLSNEQIRFRVENGIPSFTAIVKLRNEDEFELHSIHPRPPHIGVDTETRDAELILVAKEVKDLPRAVMVTGDLNDVAWSHTTRLFLRISGMLDPRIGRMFCNTFHAKYFLFRWPLDHVFHSRAFRLVELRRLRRTDSDHFPVVVELSYEPEVKQDHERPHATKADIVEAREKIELAKNGNSADPGTEIAREGHEKEQPL
ncbi:MAG TPA: endonuclease/exonuclease/phosphatase family protein [Bryobacteraceae bacterium]|nr:endonuclease/exonuclease/phosphatase family protein [Bryobacteraceae bacterium]